MYFDYFGLKEASFAITPDPHYLYLSPRHREALAHLLYGAEGNGGFVQLTGEVGTGKTTICRAFMEQIPDQVDLALILNPALTVVELLQAICREFHIPEVRGVTSRMILVDKLNHYLLEAHAHGRRPVLMIDEAQNLSADVLEQLRLLTNLETSKHKLLQIFLIGQPELQEMLQRQELRQLAQRITARYHLTPLNAAETTEYIRHRLAVAEVKRPIFNRAALRQVHKLSGGVPRLINLLCDRALLGAFATHRHTVNAAIVRRAASELQGNKVKTSNWRWLWALLLIPALPVAFVWAFMHWQDIPVAKEAIEAEKMPAVVATAPHEPASSQPSEPASSSQISEPASSSQTSESAVTHVPANQSAPVTENQPPISVESLLLDQHTAFNQLLGLWHKLPIHETAKAPCEAVQAQGLRCHEVRGTWNNVRRYQRPALLQLETASGDAYALVTGLTQNTVLVQLDWGEQEAPITQLEPYWFGDFILLWQPPPNGDALISSQSAAANIQWLKQRLAEAGYADENQSLTTQVRAFQQAEGLKADGIAGPETLIQLNTRTGNQTAPLLHLEQ